jgi:hypothetical protein
VNCIDRNRCAAWPSKRGPTGFQLRVDQSCAVPSPRWAAGFVVDPDGVTCTTALGAERMARRLGEALPDGDRPLRAAVWALMRPMLSPRLAALHADAFLKDDEAETTVDLASYRGESTLDDLDLGDDIGVAA